MNITVKYGADTMDKYFSGESVTVGEVIKNSSVKACLGYGDNIRAIIDGVEQGPSSQLIDGDVVEIEVKANSKAVVPELELMEMAAQAKAR